MSETLTGGAISTVFKKLVFTKATSGASGDIFYTQDSDGVTDEPLTTLISPLTFTGLSTFSSGISLAAGQFIKDSGGNEAIGITTTSNAVNYLQVIPSATGTGVTLIPAGDDTNIALLLDGKGSGVVSCLDDLFVTGDLTVNGNNIYSSGGGIVLTFSADDVTVAGDLTVTGASSGKMTLGADADGTDRSLVFGHTTLKSVIGIDDSGDVFAINTDAAFEGTNDFSIDASGNVAIKGDLTVTGNDIKGSAGSNVITFNSNNATFGNEVTVTGDLNMSNDKAITFVNTTGLKIQDQSGINNILFEAGGMTFHSSKTVTLAGATTISGLALLTGNHNGAAGAGLLAGSGTICKSSRVRLGDIIYTTIVLDVTGLRSDANDRVIGASGNTSPAYLTKIADAANGNLFCGKVTCLETPTADLELFTSTAIDAKEGDTASGLAAYDSLCVKGTWAAGDIQEFDNTAIPVNGEVIYLEGAATTDFTAGKFIIEMWGTV